MARAAADLGRHRHHRTGTTAFTWHTPDGREQPFSRLWVNGAIRWRPSSIVRAFELLKANTRAVPKVTIPAPILLHMYGGGDKGITEGHYKDVAEFWHDLTAAYRQELKALVAAGARYIQLDDTSIAFLCDPKYRDTVRSWGNDPDVLLRDYAERINGILEGLPGDVTVTLHQCRGNREGNWSAQGGYDPVADVLFNRINVDGYFLEYDTARAGSFSRSGCCPRARSPSSAWSRPRRPSSRPPTTSSGASTRPRASRRSNSSPSARNAALPARSGAIR